MNDKIAVNDLLDAYGELLTEKQQSICDMYFHEDYSYQEIADIESISRAAVYDTIRRCRSELARYESILHMVEDAKKRQSILNQLETMTDSAELLRLIRELKNTETQEVI